MRLHSCYFELLEFLVLVISHTWIHCSSHFPPFDCTLGSQSGNVCMCWVGQKIGLGFFVRCFGPKWTFWPTLYIVRSQYVRKIIESICSVWRTLTFRKKSASYSQRKICPVAFLFCQPFSNIFTYLLSKGRAWETRIPEKCFSRLLDQGHQLLNTPYTMALKPVYPAHSLQNGAVYWHQKIKEHKKLPRIKNQSLFERVEF